MRKPVPLPRDVEHSICHKRPYFWVNESWQPLRQARAAVSDFGINDVYDAERRLHRFAGLLQELFTDLARTDGIIESPLTRACAIQTAMMAGREQGHWFIKGDHALPIAGSIKARGGIYEVLLHAESLAVRSGFMRPEDDPRILASSQGKALFARHEVAVGSTGNLGLSIGVMAAALGFQATVHMSADAKEWKKSRLRARGVKVVEHQGDFGHAVSAGRDQARQNPNTYFVDDENSSRLFLGYSVAALRLQKQLREHRIDVTARRPLFVYLPCGVGGAPGGITFGLRHLFGDNVYCFFAEPVASPCMLIRLASTEDRAISVKDVGLDNRTDADGLAVAQASEFVAKRIRTLVSGVFTVSDDDLFEDLYLVERAEGLRIEPSAAAGFRGPRWLLESEQGQLYLKNHGLLEHINEATHILWTTGGAFVPDDEFQQFHARGKAIRQRLVC